MSEALNGPITGAPVDEVYQKIYLSIHIPKLKKNPVHKVIGRIGTNNQHQHADEQSEVAQ
jgi:hypothetical protein